MNPYIIELMLECSTYGAEGIEDLDGREINPMGRG